MSAVIWFRDGRESDRNHVLDTFAREYGKTAHGKPMGEALKRKLLTTLIESPRWTLTIACPAEGDEIYGWILHRGHDVAWLHVKDFWRRHGFARALLRRVGVGRHVGTPFLPCRVVDEWAVSSGIRIQHEPHMLLREIFPSE